MRDQYSLIITGSSLGSFNPSHRLYIAKIMKAGVVGQLRPCGAHDDVIPLVVAAVEEGSCRSQPCGYKRNNGCRYSAGR